MRSFLTFIIALMLSTGLTQAQPVSDAKDIQQRTAAQQAFRDTQGLQWTIRQNDTNGVPTAIFTALPRSQTKGEVTPIHLESRRPADKALRFFHRFSDLFGFRAETDQLVTTRSSERKGLNHFGLEQQYRNIPVFGGGYTITLDAKGNFRSLFGMFYPDIALSDVKATISSSQAVKGAVSATGVETLRGEPKTDLVIYPASGEYALAYQVIVPADAPLRTFRVFLEANTGAVLSVEDITMHIAAGSRAESSLRRDIHRASPHDAQANVVFATGSGKVYLDNPDDGSTTTVSLPRLNGSGYYLDGTYVDADNDDVSDAYETSSTFNYTPSNTHFDEVNVYYHVDRFAYDLTDAGFAGLGRTIEATVHWGTNYPNAKYDLGVTDDLFFGDGDGVLFDDLAKENDVIYHEFSHAVLHHLGTGYNTGEPGALHEGTADYLAASYTGNPRIGEWVTLCTDTGDLRRADNSDTYFHYDNLNDVEYAYCSTTGAYRNPQNNRYSNSMIWSGALWDLRSELGQSTTDELVIEAFDQLGTYPSFSQARDAIIQADNDFNSGANIADIECVFTNRGIGSTCGPPDAPTNLDVTGSTGQNPSLTWTASEGASGYDVYRCANVSYNCSNFTYIGSTSNTSYTDTEKTIGTQCGVGPDEITWYYVIATNAAGESDPSNDDSTCTDASKQDVASAEPVPEVFALRGNYPNPFNPTTTINLDLPEIAEVTVEVIDMLGRVVLQVPPQQMEAGSNRSIELDASRLATGAYLYRVVARTAEHRQVATGRLTLVK